MERRIKETIRYLGYRNGEADANVKRMICETLEEVEHIFSYKFTYRIFDVLQVQDGIMLGHTHIKSKQLKTHLNGCSRAIIFVATLGIEIDRMIHKYEVLSISKALIFQACATTILEERCDDTQSNLEQEYQRNSKRHRARFSPGYGDFSISHQREILELLQTSKDIGVSLTEGGMLVPTKSITAIVGIEEGES